MYIPQSELSRERYLELRNFCLQYPKWKIEAASMLDLSGMNYDGMPHGTDPGDPTGRAVERRDKIMNKISLVEGCAASIADGKWYAAIINNVCNGMGYELIKSLHPEWLITNNAKAFFTARKAFFLLLDRRKD